MPTPTPSERERLRSIRNWLTALAGQDPADTRGILRAIAQLLLVLALGLPPGPTSAPLLPFEPREPENAQSPE